MRGRTYVIGFAVALAGAGTVIALTWKSPSRVAATPNRLSGEASTSDDLVKNLQKRVAELERETVSRRSAAALEKLEKAQSAAPAAPSTEKELKAKRVEQQRAAMVDYERDLETTTQIERRDRVWEGNMAKGVAEQIATLGAKLTLESTQCGESMCAVKVVHEDATEHAKLSQALSRSTLGGGGLMRRHPRENGGYRTTIYLSKPGTTLPGLSEAMSGR